MKANNLLTLEELKERVAAQFDEEMLLDILGLDIYDLVEALEEHIVENWDDVVKELYD